MSIENGLGRDCGLNRRRMQLAEDLDVEESNLNPYLKKLEKRKFIIQGLPRKSTKPKRREGDYKEYPYYLNKDLGFLDR